MQQAKQKRREDLVIAYPAQHRDEETECIQTRENSADTSGHWPIRAQEMQTNVEKEGSYFFWWRMLPTKIEYTHEMKFGGVFGALFKNLKIFQNRMSRSGLNSDHFIH